jgi:hypothetical protein
MTDATWDDFVATTDPTGVVPAIIDAIADAITGSEEGWDDLTAASDTTAAPSDTDAVGDDATAQMDANLSLAADAVDSGDFSGAYDALSSAQDFNTVASDAYDADF